MVSATERETFAFRSAFQILMWQPFQITDSLAIVASKEYIRRGEGTSSGDQRTLPLEMPLTVYLL